MKKLLLMLLAVVTIVLGANAATRTISGKVVYAADNEPIIGASVVPEGGGTGAATDFNGDFKITIPENVKVVTVSYVGMTTQQVKPVDGMVVKLENANTRLDEVVVTAMGMKRERKALGYAAQDLKAEDMNTDGTTSLASAIQGKVSGVEIRPSSGAPGASSQIVIRGARSFSGNNQPLYVIDGMPVASTPDYSTGNSVTGANIADRSIDINPEDIESINVLKGQAASALYGIRASNGVILITTKRGSKESSRPVITFSTNLSAERISRKFEHQDVYAQGNSLASGYNPSSSQSWGPKIVDLPNDKNYGGNTENQFTALYGKQPGKYFNPKRTYGGLDGWTTPETFDNVGDFFGTGFTENTNFSIAQRRDNLSYSFGLSNSYQSGIIPSTGMNRWGARGLIDWELNKQWATGFSVNYASTRITSAPGANSGIVNVVYSAPREYDLKGIPSHMVGDPTSQLLFRSTSFDNPYWWANNCEYLQHTNRVYGNAYVEYKPNLNWGDNFKLSFREQAGLDVYTSDYSEINEVGSAAASNGSVENYGVSRNIFNNLLTANFNAVLGDEEQWDISVMLGNEINQDNARIWDYYGSGFNFYGLPTMSNATNYSSSESTSKDRTVGFFGQVSASWKNQLYLTVTGRNDYVSTMPHGNRSFFYPSVSLGWLFTEIKSVKNNLPWLTFGKLRASLAQVGQAGTYRENYCYVPGYGSGFYAYYPVSYPLSSGVSSYVPYYQVYDDNLKPQNTTNFEFGTDLRFFNNRLSVEYTFSYQSVKDQIFAVPIDGATGYQYMITNGGHITTKSHEINIQAALLQARDYSLDLGINFTHIYNYVNELAPGVESIMLGGFAEPQIRAQAGCTYPNIYGNAFQRDPDGNLLLVDGLPVASNETVNLGNCSPDFNMGITFGGRYKRVSLNTTWSWQHGGKMYHGTNMTMNYFGATKESLPYHEGTMIASGTQEIDNADGSVAYVPNDVEVTKQAYYQAYYDVTESGIYDMSFLKLRDVTLTYQLPKFGNFDISVFAYARNILVWSKLPNFDPESSQGNGNMGGYFERFSVPNTSSFGAGFKVTF